MTAYCLVHPEEAGLVPIVDGQSEICLVAKAIQDKACQRLRPLAPLHFFFLCAIAYPCSPAWFHFLYGGYIAADLKPRSILTMVLAAPARGLACRLVDLTTFSMLPSALPGLQRTREDQTLMMDRRETYKQFKEVFARRSAKNRLGESAGSAVRR